MDKTPSISIIIPTYNRPGRLRSCLQSIADLEPGNHLIQTIVVDDGSLPSCEPIMQEFTGQINLNYFYTTNSGPASARNHGAAHAKAPFLAFIDDDCTLPPNWLNTILKHTWHDCMTGGKTINCLPENRFASASQALIDFLYSYYNKDHHQARFLTSNNMVMPKEMFLQMNGFDTTFPFAAAEDRDLCDRCLFSGYTLNYSSEINVYHWHRMTLRSYLRQHFTYGRGAVVYHQQKAVRMKTKLRMEPLRFYSSLLLWPFRNKTLNNRFQLSFLLLMSQASNAIGFFLGKAIPTVPINRFPG